MTLLDTARRYHAAGLNIIPFNTVDKSLPNKWERWQEERVQDQDLVRWFDGADPKHVGIAIICGDISGGVVVLDFDQLEFFTAWQQKVEEVYSTALTNLPLVLEKSGSGKGRHVFVRVAQAGTKKKLAWKPMTPEPQPDGSVKYSSGRTIGIELQANKNLIFVAPSLHPSGGSYEVLSGDLTAIPLVEQEFLDTLIAVAISLDRCPKTLQQQAAEERAANRPKREKSSQPQESVIDRYNAAHDIEDLLDRYYAKASRIRWAVREDPKRGSIYVVDGNKSLHWDSNDPLEGPYARDPFALYAYWEFGELDGQYYESVKAAAKEMGMGSNTQQPVDMMDPGPDLVYEDESDFSSYTEDDAVFELREDLPVRSSKLVTKQQANPEEVLVACTLKDPATFGRVAPHCDADDIDTESFRQIYMAGLESWSKDRATGGGPENVFALLAEWDTLGLVGGLADLKRLAALDIDADKAVPLAKAVRAQAELRRAKEIADKLPHLISSRDLTPAGKVALIKDEVEKVKRTFKPRRRLRTMDEVMDDFDTHIDSTENRIVVPTWIKPLDVALNGGVERKGFNLCAARPGVGKSTLGTMAAYNNADHGQPVYYYSGEMEDWRIALRMGAAMQDEFSINALRRSDLLTDREKKQIKQTVSKKLRSLPIFWNPLDLDTIAFSPDDIIADLYQAEVELGVMPLVVIDHIGTMEVNGVQSVNRTQVIGEAARTLKAIFRVMDCASFVQSQLNREIERRKDPTPMLSDLAESGKLEMYADLVMMLDRPDMRDPSAIIDTPMLDIYIRKFRDGQTNTMVRLKFFAEHGRLSGDPADFMDYNPQTREMEYKTV